MHSPASSRSHAALPILLVTAVVGAPGSASGAPDDAEAAGAVAADVDVPAGYEVTLFAAPPDVSYPACLAASLDGKVYVGVDQDGSLGNTERPGVIVRCADTDGDGAADAFTEFAEVEHPRGLVVDGSTVWALSPPEVTVFHDDDGDGVADRSKVLIRGMSTDQNQKRGADHTTNGMRLGIDGWIYVAVGDFGFVEATGTDGSTARLYGGGVARFRPDGSHLEIYARGTRNIYDIAIDPFLRIFSRDNTNDGGGWDVRLHHFLGGGTHHGYPTLYENFPREMVQPLGEYGGGSGTGALYIDEPGWNDGTGMLLTTDWGRHRVYRHTLEPDGASFATEQSELITVPRPTDLDIDGRGRLYLASWKGGQYQYGGPDVGFIARVIPEGHDPSPPPELDAASGAELLEHLASPSQVLRLHAQREILRRGREAVSAADLAELAASEEREPEGRAAALFTLAQMEGEETTGHLLAFAEDPALRALALRALASRAPYAEDVPVEPFVRGVEDDDPRVRLEAAVGLGRRGGAPAASALIGALDDRDASVVHAAVASLVRLGAGTACLEALDGASAPRRDGLIRVLQALHDPAVVDGLIARLDREADAGKRLALFRALARLYHTEHEWKGGWWGTRPDSRGPYFRPVTWSASEEIAAALEGALDAASGDAAAELLPELSRHRVSLDAALKTLSRLRPGRPGHREAILEVLASRRRVPPGMRSLLERIAGDDEAAPDLRARAIRILERVPGEEARDAFVTALARMLEEDRPGGEVVELFERYVSRRRRARELEYFAELARSGEGAERVIGCAVLVRVAQHRRVRGERRRTAQRAVSAAWADPATLPAMLEAVGRTRAEDYAGQVRTAALQEDPEVREAARFAARRLRLDAASGTPEGEAIGDLAPERVIAEALEAEGDPGEGKVLFERQGCTACHTVSPDERPKGPMLAGIAERYSRRELVESVLRPSATIAQGFASQSFVLKDGTVQVGFVTRESGDEIELRNAAGLPTVIEAGEIAARGEEESSIMPEGLVDNLGPEQLASIIAYLESLESVASE